MPAGVVGAALLPHPPIAVPGVSKDHVGRISATVRAMHEAAEAVRRIGPDVVVLVSPHGPVSSRGVALSSWPDMEGDMSAFGLPQARAAFRGDVHLARHLAAAFKSEGIDASLEDRPDPQGIDHGSMVPLWYLGQAHVGARLLLVSGVRGGPKEAARIGRVVAETLAGQHLGGFLIASGDLSHRLTPGAPAGYDPAGERFDRELVDLVATGDTERLLGLDMDLIRRAGECGYLPLCLVAGALGGEWRARVLSYEGPFGVGYAVASMYPANHLESLYVDVARAAILHHLRDGTPYPASAALPGELTRQAGAFVSLKKAGSLRGCMGTLGPQERTLEAEIAANAVLASTRDPRFPPVDSPEVSSLDITVDVLSQPEAVDGPDQLDPARYGVIVEKGARRGLLLPYLKGIDTAEQQVAIASRKAGIAPGESGVELYRFTVERYGAGEKET